MEGKVEGGRVFDFNETGGLARPLGAFLGDEANLRNEERYKGVWPAQRAREVLNILHNASILAADTADQRSQERLCEAATLEVAGSRFAEEIFHQSDGLHTIASLLCSGDASYEEKSIALTILKVVSNSGNRRLPKAMLRSHSLLEQLLQFVVCCSPDIVSTMAPIRFSPCYSASSRSRHFQSGSNSRTIRGPSLLSMPLRREQVCSCPQGLGDDFGVPKNAQCIRRSLDYANPGEGVLIGDLRGHLMESINHIRHLCGENVTRFYIPSEDLRCSTRAGQRCSNPDCPIVHQLSYSQKTPSLPECARCHINAYCSDECQQQHWPEHKVHCKKQAKRKVWCSDLSSEPISFSKLT